MADKLKYYLKDHVKFEPAIFQWPAWPQTVPPVNAGLHVKNRYLKIMESYLEAPEVHYAAANNPNLVGGPFINIDPSQQELVREIYENIKLEAKDLIELADGIHKLNNLIMKEAKGHGIEPLYKQIPSSLKGMVELFYDLNNFPRLRLIEPLLYKHYYNAKHQSVIMSLMDKDFRPFVLSTPLIAQGNDIKIKRPFNDRLYDKLFSARSLPVTKDFIAEIFETTDPQNIIDVFFQESPSNRSLDNTYQGDGVRVRYFGHACVLIETKNTSILIDPLISYQYQSDLKRFTFSDLPERINYVLFTHAHEDHIVFETILQLRHKVDNFVLPRDRQGNLADPSVRLIMEHLGFDNLISLEEFASISTQDGEIIGLPFLGEHCDVEVTSKLGYCVVAKDKKFLFLADSNNIEPYMYKLIFDEIGAVDTTFIGMESVGGPLSFQYGGLITIPVEYGMDQSRRLSGSDFSKAINIVEQSKCKNAYVYAMGQEPWLNHLMALNYEEESPQIVNSKKFVSECRSRGIHSELLFGQREWQL